MILYFQRNGNIVCRGDTWDTASIIIGFLVYSRAQNKGLGRPTTQIVVYICLHVANKRVNSIPVKMIKALRIKSLPKIQQPNKMSIFEDAELVRGSVHISVHIICVIVMLIDDVKELTQNIPTIE